MQLFSFPKVLRPSRRASAARSSAREARGRGAISVIPARQILGYRTFEGPCAFRRPIPLRNRLGKAKRAGRSSFSIQAMPASPVPRVHGHREIRWEVECTKVVLVASRNILYEWMVLQRPRCDFRFVNVNRCLFFSLRFDNLFFDFLETIKSSRSYYHIR